MKRFLAISVLCMAVALVVSAQAKDVPNDVQQTLISLDKQWGEAGGDTAKLDKIIGADLLAVSSKGEAQDKHQLIADNKLPAPVCRMLLTRQTNISLRCSTLTLL